MPACTHAFEKMCVFVCLCVCFCSIQRLCNWPYFHVCVRVRVCVRSYMWCVHTYMQNFFCRCFVAVFFCAHICRCCVVVFCLSFFYSIMALSTAICNLTYVSTCTHTFLSAYTRWIDGARLSLYACRSLYGMMCRPCMCARAHVPT